MFSSSSSATACIISACISANDYDALAADRVVMRYCYAMLLRTGVMGCPNWFLSCGPSCYCYGICTCYNMCASQWSPVLTSTPLPSWTFCMATASWSTSGARCTYCCPALNCSHMASYSAVMDTRCILGWAAFTFSL